MCLLKQLLLVLSLACILCTPNTLQFLIELHVPDLTIVVQPAPDLGQQKARELKSL